LSEAQVEEAVRSELDALRPVSSAPARIPTLADVALDVLPAEVRAAIVEVAVSNLVATATIGTGQDLCFAGSPVTWSP